MLYSIHLCRAIAALLVVLFHSAGNLAKEKYFGILALPLEQIFWFGGQVGVDFFFVLSGFVMYYVHRKDFDHPERLASYARKRVTRIYPTYIILFVGVYLLAKLIPALQNSVPSDMGVIIKSLLLLPQDKQVVGGTGAPVIVAAWSLQYEMLFYSVFALALIRRWMLWTAAVILGVNLLAQFISGPYGFPRNFLASHAIVLFAFGILAAAAARSKIVVNFPGRLVLISLFVFGGFVLLSVLNRDSYNPLFDLCYGLTSAILIFGLVRYENKKGQIDAAKRLSIYGDSSYALYLLHFPLIAILSKISILVLPLNLAGVLIAFIFLVTSSVFAGVVFHLLIEKPILRRLSSWA